MTEEQIFDMRKVIDAEAERLRKSGQLSGQPNASDTEAQKYIDLKYAALKEALFALSYLADFYDGTFSNNEVGE